MKKNIGLLGIFFILFLNANVFAQTTNSFFDIFDKLAKEKLEQHPKEKIEKKAFEFVPIVKEGEPVTFKMGSDRLDSEKPIHYVTLTEPFEMQKTEVTQLQWFLVMGKNPSYFKEGGTEFRVKETKETYAYSESVFINRPVESVSYDAIQTFITKLNELDTGYKYSLPTEAQWEFSARGDAEGKNTTIYCFGDDRNQLTNYAWSMENGREVTHDVASKLPNKFKLYDMYGNLWEFMDDYYYKNYYSYLVKNSNEITDPKGPENGDGHGHVLRGGSIGADKDVCRSAVRVESLPNGGSQGGFRLVRTAK